MTRTLPAVLFLAALPAAAQNYSASARSASAVRASPVLALPLGAPSLTPSAFTAPSLLSASLTPALAAPAPAAVAAAAPVAAPALAAVPAAARAQLASAAAPIRAAAVSPAAAAEAPARLDALYDGARARADEAPAVAGRASKTRGVLGTRTDGRRAALFAAVPGVALAATDLSLKATMTALAAYAPWIAAGAALIGALFGLFAARGKDGAPAAGEVIASTMRYGVVAGAAAFVLLDILPMVFLGAEVGLRPLTAAVATAALGQTAFAQKFTEPTTTPADRIVGAFPAVAAAFGLSLAAAPALTAGITLAGAATALMMLSGAAVALYVALYSPARSPQTGPAHMGRGFTLQALMSGMALAVASPYYSAFFLALALAGFALVAFAAGREAWTAAKALSSRGKSSTPKD